MREILFQGKVKNSVLWVEGNLIVDERGNCYIGQYIPLKKDIKNITMSGGRTVGKTLNRFLGIGFVMVDKETVRQYTGLTDNNGKKIFEGDILKVKHGIVGREEEKPKMPRNAYGLHYKENERGMFGRWFYYRNYAVEYKAHGNSRGKYIVRNGSDQCDFTHSLFYNHDAEIIGNIHDNLELLKGATL